MRKLIVLLLILTALPSTTFAIKGTDSCNYDFIETGQACFLLYQNGRLFGAISPDEDMGTTAMQTTSYLSPAWIREGCSLRRHNWTQVKLDENHKIACGGINLRVTIILTDVLAVQSVVEDMTVANIIDATIYSPNISYPTPKAAHMFLTNRNRDRQVGEVIFANGTVLALYIGDFDGDGAPDLGFKPLVLSSPEENDTCPDCGCKCTDACKCTCTCKTCNCQPPVAPKPKSKPKCTKVITTLSVKFCVQLSTTIMKFGCCK